MNFHARDPRYQRSFVRFCFDAGVPVDDADALLKVAMDKEISTPAMIVLREFYKAGGHYAPRVMTRAPDITTGRSGPHSWEGGPGAYAPDPTIGARQEKFRDALNFANNADSTILNRQGTGADANKTFMPNGGTIIKNEGGSRVALGPGGKLVGFATPSVPTAGAVASTPGPHVFEDPGMKTPFNPAAHAGAHDWSKVDVGKLPGEYRGDPLVAQKLDPALGLAMGPKATQDFNTRQEARRNEILGALGPQGIPGLVANPAAGSAAAGPQVAAGAAPTPGFSPPQPTYAAGAPGPQSWGQNMASGGAPGVPLPGAGPPPAAASAPAAPTAVAKGAGPSAATPAAVPAAMGMATPSLSTMTNGNFAGGAGAPAPPTPGLAPVTAPPTQAPPPDRLSGYGAGLAAVGHRDQAVAAAQPDPFMAGAQPEPAIPPLASQQPAPTTAPAPTTTPATTAAPASTTAPAPTTAPAATTASTPPPLDKSHSLGVTKPTPAGAPAGAPPSPQVAANAIGK
jgi:hypothetical protein